MTLCSWDVQSMGLLGWTALGLALDVGDVRGESDPATEFRHGDFDGRLDGDGDVGIAGTVHQSLVAGAVRSTHLGGGQETPTDRPTEGSTKLLRHQIVQNWVYR